jgi:DNA-binding PadR family transcriptional regulator
LLVPKPRHGYELRAAFEAVVGGDANWDVKPAQIYTTLDRLEEARLVTRNSDLGEGDEPSRRIYAISPQGEKTLAEWLACGVTPDHQRDEFFVKLMVGMVSGIMDPARLVQTQRAHLYRELHDATAVRERYDPKLEMAQILLVDKAIMHIEADLRWLDMIEMRLETIQHQPLPKPEVRPRGRPKKKE